MFLFKLFFFLIGGVKKFLFESFAVIFVKENLQKMLAGVQGCL